MKGQEAVQPSLIEPDPKETSTLYFGFLPQIVQLDSDKTVTFETTMDPLKVKAKFEMKTMKFKEIWRCSGEEGGAVQGDDGFAGSG